MIPQKDEGLGWLQSSEILTSDINLFREFGRSREEKYVELGDRTQRFFSYWLKVSYLIFHPPKQKKDILHIPHLTDHCLVVSQDDGKLFELPDNS